MDSNVLVRFIRDKHNHPIGAMVATGKNEIGWSLCAKKDRKFGRYADKELAVQIAHGRAITGVNPEFMPPSIVADYAKMADRADRYFK